MSQSVDSQLTGIKKDVEYLVKKTDKIDSLLEQEYVTVDQHGLLVQRVDVLQKIVWGFVGLILVGFGTAIVNFFISNGKI